MDALETQVCLDSTAREGHLVRQVITESTALEATKVTRERKENVLGNNK